MIDVLNTYGDAIITYRSQESKKLKYNVCTLQINSDYINEKHNRAKETEDTLLMFCWDVDAFRLMNVSSVVKIEPLAKALKDSANGR